VGEVSVIKSEVKRFYKRGGNGVPHLLERLLCPLLLVFVRQSVTSASCFSTIGAIFFRKKYPFVKYCTLWSSGFSIRPQLFRASALFPPLQNNLNIYSGSTPFCSGRVRVFKVSKLVPSWNHKGCELIRYIGIREVHRQSLNYYLPLLGLVWSWASVCGWLSSGWLWPRSSQTILG
jgi:hypothetical protein